MKPISIIFVKYISIIMTLSVSEGKMPSLVAVGISPMLQTFESMNKSLRLDCVRQVALPVKWEQSSQDQLYEKPMQKVRSSLEHDPPLNALGLLYLSMFPQAATERNVRSYASNVWMIVRELLQYVEKVAVVLNIPNNKLDGTWEQTYEEFNQFMRKFEDAQPPVRDRVLLLDPSSDVDPVQPYPAVRGGTGYLVDGAQSYYTRRLLTSDLFLRFATKPLPSVKRTPLQLEEEVRRGDKRKRGGSSSERKGGKSSLSHTKSHHPAPSPRDYDDLQDSALKVKLEVKSQLLCRAKEELKELRVANCKLLEKNGELKGERRLLKKLLKKKVISSRHIPSDSSSSESSSDSSEEEGEGEETTTESVGASASMPLSSHVGSQEEPGESPPRKRDWQ